MLTLSEIQKLQIHRHEMQNFVEVMQRYVSVQQRHFNSWSK